MWSRAALPQRCRKVASCDYEAIVDSSAFPHSITDAADRVNQPGLSRAVNLLTKAVNVHLHEIGLAIEVTIPNVLNDFGPRDGVGRILHQQFDERKFLCRKRDH